MSPQTGLCALCRAVDENSVEVRRIYDSHLLCSDSFVVIPAVGPIAPGHVMVVSRDHSPNLASVGQTRIQEYRSLVGLISEHRGFGRLLEAEHGASDSESGGACITHVHVNLIPGFGELAEALEPNLPTQEIDYELHTLQPRAAPYILLRGNGVVRLYRAQAVPSQLIRRLLFARLGRDDWDWGAYPNLDVVKQTLEVWNEQFDGQNT